MIINIKKDYDLIKKSNFRLKDIYYSFLKNKKFILAGGFLGAFVSIIYGLFLPEIYRARMQVLIERKPMENVQSIIGNNQMIGAFYGLNKEETGSKTQLMVFNSPKVLMQVYNYVKGEKIKNKSNFKLTFKEWQKQVNIMRVPATSILNISYDDPSENIIIPVIERIYSSLNNYEKNIKNNSIDNSISFLQKEESKLLIKSKISSKKAIEYAIDNNLSLSDSIPRALNSDKGGTSANYRITSSAFGSSKDTQIDLIKTKINTIKNNLDSIETDNTKSVALSKKFNLTELSSLNNKLLAINIKIADKLRFYKPNDEFINELKEQKLNLEEQIQITLKNYLKGELIDLEANLKFLKRPKDVLINYQNLVKDSIINNKLLNDVQSQLTSLKLERKRKELPWQIILGPKKLSKPVSPNFLRIILFGSLLTFSLFLVLSIVIDNNQGIIYDDDDLQDKLHIDNLGDYSNIPIRKNINYFLDNLIENHYKEETCFVLLGNTLNINLNDFKSLIKNTKFKNFKIHSEYDNYLKFKNHILLISIENIRKNNIDNYLELIKLKKIKSEGYLLI